MNVEIIILEVNLFGSLYTKGVILINLNQEACMRSTQ
jgi:hypothetical protein